MGGGVCGGGVGVWGLCVDWQGLCGFVQVLLKLVFVFLKIWVGVGGGGGVFWWWCFCGQVLVDFFVFGFEDMFGFVGGVECFYVFLGDECVFGGVEGDVVDCFEFL